jgi:hypothetical protein
MKALVRTIGVLGSAAWILPAILAFVVPFEDPGDGSGYSISEPGRFWGICPLIYFVICFFTSFAKRRGVQVVTWGIIGHVALINFLVLSFVEHDNGYVFLIPSLMVTIAWIGMYLGLDNAPPA